MAYLTDDELLDTEDGFTEWDEDTAAGSTEETLEQALAEERLAELESELEQDEHPVDYDTELETEEEEAAPVSEKRLLLKIRDNPTFGITDLLTPCIFNEDVVVYIVVSYG